MLRSDRFWMPVCGLTVWWWVMIVRLSGLCSTVRLSSSCWYVRVAGRSCSSCILPWCYCISNLHVLPTISRHHRPPLPNLHPNDHINGLWACSQMHVKKKIHPRSDLVASFSPLSSSPLPRPLSHVMPRQILFGRHRDPLSSGYRSIYHLWWWRWSTPLLQLQPAGASAAIKIDGNRRALSIKHNQAFRRPGPRRMGKNIFRQEDPEIKRKYFHIPHVPSLALRRETALLNLERLTCATPLDGGGSTHILVWLLFAFCSVLGLIPLSLSLLATFPFPLCVGRSGWGEWKEQRRTDTKEGRKEREKTAVWESLSLKMYVWCFACRRWTNRCLSQSHEQWF